MHFKDLCSKQCCLGTAGLFLAISGLLFATFWVDIFQHMLAKEMALRPGSRSYDAWKTPPLPLNMDIYFFNWTNPEDLKVPHTKPILAQLGPYRFKEKKEKVAVNWHPENASVSFKTKSTFFFDEAGSAGRLDDVITTVNVIALTAAAKSKKWSYLKQKSVSMGLSVYKQNIHITKSARELLFEGYSDNIIDIARELPVFGEDMEVPFDRFGWFYPRNGSADLIGHFNMFTGEDDIKKIGKMNTWNYHKRTTAFESYCGMVNGSAGEYYPPHLTKNSTLSLFTPDICRTLNFDFTETVNVMGIEGYKFSGTPKSVDNGTKYPENQCFCGDECVRSGVIGIAGCRYGSPVYMSYPHFFNADPFYPGQIYGLQPLKEKHEFYMIMEPTTGIPLEVAARFQVNVLLEGFSHVALYERVPKIFFPVLWFEQKVAINEELASELKTLLIMPTAGHISAGVIFTIGLMMMCWFPVDKIVRRTHKSLKENKNIDKKDLDNTEKSPEGSPLLLENGKTANITFIGSTETEKDKSTKSV